MILIKIFIGKQRHIIIMKSSFRCIPLLIQLILYKKKSFGHQKYFGNTDTMILVLQGGGGLIFANHVSVNGFGISDGNY